MAERENETATAETVAALALVTLALTYVLAVVLGLLLCAENERHEVCGWLEGEMVSVVGWSVPPLLVVLAGLARGRRFALIVLGGYAAVVAGITVALTLAL